MKLPRSKSKYGNIKTVIDGITFDSRKEAARFCELKLLQRAGKIDGLTCQVPFEVRLNGEKICVYVADFRYLDLETTGYVIEDVKGMRTPVYKLKKRLVEAQYGIVITEI